MENLPRIPGSLIVDACFSVMSALDRKVNAIAEQYGNVEHADGPRTRRHKRYLRAPPRVAPVFFRSLTSLPAKLPLVCEIALVRTACGTPGPGQRLRNLTNSEVGLW